eukprot:503256-Pleurochrysis_carterae.AAC.1
MERLFSNAVSKEKSDGKEVADQDGRQCLRRGRAGKFLANGPNHMRCADDQILAPSDAECDALRKDPAPRYAVAPRVTAAAFDNSSIRASG